MKKYTLFIILFVCSLFCFSQKTYVNAPCQIVEENPLCQMDTTIDTIVGKSTLPFFWNTVLIDRAGFYSVVYKTPLNCDSLINLNVLISEPTEVSKVIYLNQQQSSQFGSYDTTYVYTNDLGLCDSIIHIYYIAHNDSVDIVDTVIDRISLPFVWHKHKFYHSDTYRDRELLFVLNVDESKMLSLHKYICQGETYSIGDKSYNTPGHYFIDLNDQSDHILNLHLDQLHDPMIRVISYPNEISTGHKLSLSTPIVQGDSIIYSAWELSYDSLFSNYFNYTINDTVDEYYDNLYIRYTVANKCQQVSSDVHQLHLERTNGAMILSDSSDITPSINACDYDIKVFPNPTIRGKASHFYISSTACITNDFVQITSIDGKVFYKKHNPSADFYYMLPQGQYVVSLYVDNILVCTTKFIHL